MRNLHRTSRENPQAAAPDFFAEAASEWRTAKKSPARRREPLAVPDEIEREALRAHVFDGLSEVSRFAVGAQVAIAAEDYGLATECLRSLVSNLKPALRAWERHEAARPESEAA